MSKGEIKVGDVIQMSSLPEMTVTEVISSDPLKIRVSYEGNDGKKETCIVTEEDCE